MFQQTILIGNVGIDPEIRYLQSGKAIGKFTLATKEGYFDNSSNWIQQTEWHRITVFGKLAENVVGKFVKKGDLLQIVGKLKSSSFEKDGQKHRNTEIIATSITLFPKGKREESNNSENTKPKYQKSKNPPSSGGFEGGFDPEYGINGNNFDDFSNSHFSELPSDMMEDNSAPPSDDIPF